MTMDRRPSRGDDVEAVPRVYTLEETAELMNVSVTTVRRWIRRRELHSYKCDGKRMVGAQHIAAFLEAHEQ